MSRVKQSSKKSNSKTILNSKRVVIDIADLLGLEEVPMPQKGFPDVLSIDLQPLVDAVEENPRLLYDENYVISNQRKLVYYEQSYIRCVLDMLQLVGLENPSRDEDVYIERLRKARSWIEKFFDAAKSGMTKRVKFLGGRPKKLPLSHIVLKDYTDTLEKFTQFLKANYSQYVVEKKIKGRIYLKLKEFKQGYLLDDIMKNFFLANKNDEIPYVAGLSLKNKRETSTAEKIVKLLVAIKHNTTPKMITKLLKKAKKAKQPTL